MAMQHLSAYAKDITSQWGEDGILEEIFRRIGSGNKTCVEFGAWDGKHYSNTWNLWHERDWTAVLIEEDPIRVAELKTSTSAFPKVTPHLAHITPEGPNSVDAILEKIIPGKTVDLMSIDIDSDDYYVFESLHTFLPRVVVIEYNPTIPPHLHMVQAPGEYFGASAKALIELAESKGYAFVTITRTNLFFVKTSEVAKLELSQLPILEEVFDKSSLTYIVSNFGGITFATRVPMYTNFSAKRLPLDEIPQIHSQEPIIPIFFGKNEPLMHKISQKIKRELRASLKGTFVQRWAQELRLKRNQSIAHARHEEKQKAVLSLKEKFPSLAYLIETGTYRGDMVRAMKRHFEKVFSIELSDPLYQAATQEFSQDKNVFLFQGDSGEVLPRILTTIDKPSLFWLDAHYSKGDTARGTLDTPISQELEAVLKHHLKSHAILIDDAQYFNGTNGYPTIEALTAKIRSLDPHRRIVIADDVIQIHPSSHA